MKKLYAYALKVATILLITVSFSACNVEPEYVYCNNGVIEVVNNSPYTIYYSWRSDYCNIPLYSGQSTVLELGQIQSNVRHPDSEQFFYSFDYPGYAEYNLDIEITECYTSIVLD